SIYNEIYELCTDYICNDDAVFWVEITEKDIDFERGRANLDEYSDAYLETLAVYRKISEKLLDFDTFLMHGVALGLDGNGYIFTAPSGVGKTTHTRFWCEKYPDAFIVNGDKPLIKVTDSGVFVCGTPWSGKEMLNKNIILPLKSICTLFRGRENIIKLVKFSEISHLIIGQTYRPSDAEKLQKTLELIKKVSEKVRTYALFCNLDPDSARVAKEGMIDNG
ncbi:MAG: hypothetical protein IKR46_01905, partial [Clostridia bacterium]|nr:hypothetical protein [Clostridia bacterium]